MEWYEIINIRNNVHIRMIHNLNTDPVSVFNSVSLVIIIEVCNLILDIVEYLCYCIHTVYEWLFCLLVPFAVVLYIISKHRCIKKLCLVSCKYNISVIIYRCKYIDTVNLFLYISNISWEKRHYHFLYLSECKVVVIIRMIDPSSSSRFIHRNLYFWL